MTPKRNPVFWLMWALPAAAVVASFTTLAIAMSGADRPLPPTYHWEGAGLDQDFERARHAAELGLTARLDVEAATHECVLRLDGAGGASSVRLLLTHSHDADLDRQVLLRAVRPGEFRADCAPFPAGKWRIALDDEASTWSLRAQVDGAVNGLELRARHPRGPS